MKKLHTLLAVLAVVLASNAFAEDLGLKLSNLQLNSFNSYGTMAKGKSSGKSGGIQKGLVQFDIGFTVGGHSYVAPSYRNYYYGGRAAVAIGATPGVMFNVDVAVHPYVSVGGYFGIDGSVGVEKGLIGIGLGARATFHIYQLIADKANTKLDPGKLDFYFPFHMGTIIGVATSKYGGGHSAGFEVGGGLGVRYYFTDMVGVFTEVGWLETSVWKAGLSLKF